MTKNTPQWLDKQEYPFTNKYLSIQGFNLHYIDEGKGDVLLFVHGTPSWSFDYRHIIKVLSKNYRCVALDHIGFGLSDKPKNYDYSVQHHAENLKILIESLALKNITLIVHDFGGVIGFDYALKHPENIKKLVVLNSWLWDSSEDKSYQKLKPILKSPLLPFLYLYLNFSPKLLIPKSFVNKKRLTKKIHQQYILPFSSKDERRGTLGFAYSLLNDQQWFESLWKKISLLKNKPILLIWGMKDSFITPSYLKKFASGFENPAILEIEDCGHFPQEEQPEIVLSVLQRFLE
ncbi:MAG: alpha/beta fold hydrolase [Flammeovirgaceae bacterium]